MSEPARRDTRTVYFQKDEHARSTETGHLDRLRLRRWADIRAELDAQPAPRWLVRGLIPEGTYGVLAAEEKVGKTWAALDLALSIACGQPWLNSFDCPTPGPVAYYLGEGDQQEATQRLNAIARERGLEADELHGADLYLSSRVPHLSNGEHLTFIADDLAEHDFRLVIVDPLYLAARGAKGSDLYSMGETLEALQLICQDLNATLLVVTHLNRREGNGLVRLWGAGPGQWGRIIITASLENPETIHVADSHVTVDAVTAWEVKGPRPRRFRIRRRLLSHIEDLTAPVTYELEHLPDSTLTRHPHGLSGSQARVMQILEAQEGWCSAADIQEVTGNDETGLRHLKLRTVQAALKALTDSGLAEAEEPIAGGAKVWRARLPHQEGETCA